MTKNNFDEQKKLNFVLIYNFVIKVSSVMVFDINILANITLMGKYQENIKKSKTNWIQFEQVLNAFYVLHYRATLEYQHTSDSFMWRWPSGNLMYITINLRMLVHVFCWEVCEFNCSSYLCVRYDGTRKAEHLGITFYVVCHDLLLLVPRVFLGTLVIKF